MSGASCPKCGVEQSEGGDFCRNPVCRAYLAWDVPPTLRKVPPKTSKERGEQQDSRKQTPEKASAAITLFGEDAQQRPRKVAAGERIAMQVRVRNQSEIVDSYVLAVKDFKGERWWTIEPQEVHLLPVDTDERYEQEVSVLLHPPRIPSASAKCWSIEITAMSVAHHALAACAPTRVEIEAFEEIVLAVSSPPEASRRGSALKLKLTNNSNHAVTVALSGSEEKGKCHVSIAQTRCELEPGESRPIDVTVRPSERLLIGHPVDRTLRFTAEILAAADTDTVPANAGDADTLKMITVSALGAGVVGAVTTDTSAIGTVTTDTSAAGTGMKDTNAVTGNTEETDIGIGSAEQPAACATTYTQRSWLPWWTPRVLATVIAVALLVVAYCLKLDMERIAVPNVKGHYISEARAELKAAGLEGKEHLEVTTLTSVPSDKPGHASQQIEVGDVIREEPEVGTRLKPKSEVVLYTAVRPHAKPVSVPNLYELPPEAAEKALAAAGFAIGDIQPYPPPKDDLIVSQTPKAETSYLPTRTVVDVKLGQLAAVPAVFGQSPAAAGEKLRAVSLVMGKVLPRKSRPSEVVAVQSPAANTVVPVGDTVNVELGEVVPKLVGLTLLQARGQLGGAGFAQPMVSPTDAPPTDVVVSQNPAADSIVLEGTHVKLVAKPRPTRAKAKPKQSVTTGSKTGTSSKTGTDPTAGSNSTDSTNSTKSTNSTTGAPDGTATESRAETSAQAVGAVAAPNASASPQRGVRPEPCPDQQTRQTQCPAESRRWRR
jgi:beta-lactam-binding protein with PASTA domain